MMTNPIPELLGKIPNWFELAAQAKYQVPALAALLHTNVRTLERRFRQELQTTPQEWLNHLRQMEAERLLDIGKRIKEIADLLGYTQASHFCRHFKESHGMTPKMWKRLIAKAGFSVANRLWLRLNATDASAAQKAQLEIVGRRSQVPPTPSGQARPDASAHASAPVQKGVRLYRRAMVESAPPLDGQAVRPTRDENQRHRQGTVVQVRANVLPRV